MQPTTLHPGMYGTFWNLLAMDFPLLSWVLAKPGGSHVLMFICDWIDRLWILDRKYVIRQPPQDTGVSRHLSMGIIQ